jgi:hypothetical protein
MRIPMITSLLRHKRGVQATAKNFMRKLAAQTLADHAIMPWPALLVVQPFPNERWDTQRSSRAGRLS